MTRITHVLPSSPAYLRVLPGEYLFAINGVPILDVLDYEFHSYDKDPRLTLKTEDGQWKICQIRKPAGVSLGLIFPTYLMDEPRACQNACPFCFIAQLPSGLRSSLYFKDDDFRLSFLTGNYISLTNISEEEFSRLLRLKISPIHVSIHATDSTLRTKLFANPQAAKGFAMLQQLKEAGIQIQGQIVLCPGLNDAAALSRSMEDLYTLFPALQSVSIVPVGLTKYRENLPELRPYTPALAQSVIAQVEQFAQKCLGDIGTRLFYLADEFFLKAGAPLPPADYYEDYLQLENGVGMLRHLEEDLLLALEEQESLPSPAPFSIATGTSAAPFLQGLLAKVLEKCPSLECFIHPIVNDFFGAQINVAGLLTGQDIIHALSGKNLGERLLIPQSMLRHGEEVFLDDISLSAVSSALGVPVIPVVPSGAALLQAIFFEEKSNVKS